MGISDTVGSATLNWLHSYTDTIQFIAFNASLNFTHNANEMATRACTTNDDFVAVTQPVFIDTEVNKLPFKMTQTSLVTNPNWSNSDENLHVYMIAPDGSVYLKANFNGGFYEITNKPTEIERTRLNETFNLMLMHRVCAIVPDTIYSSLSDLTTAQNRLKA